MTARPSGWGVTVDPDVLIAARGAVLRQPGADPAVSALPGGFVIRRRGQGQEIADSRVYQPGDDMRHVDRGATARSGRLHVRTFQEERDRVVFLVADFRNAMLWGMRRAFRSVAAAEALALIGWQAVEAGGRVGLLAITGAGNLMVPTRGRTRGMLDVIGGMVKAHDTALRAAREAPGDQPLDLALAGLRRVVPGGSAVVIATGMDRPGAGLGDVLGALAMRRHPRFLIVEDAALGSMLPGHYPLRAADGARRRAIIGRRGGYAAEEPAPPPGYPTVRIDAGAPVPADILALGR